MGGEAATRPSLRGEVLPVWDEVQDAAPKRGDTDAPVCGTAGRVKEAGLCQCRVAPLECVG